MDTPDKAAGFADPELAEAVNKEWLLVSASSQHSTNRVDRQRNQVRWMTKSYSVNDKDCSYQKKSKSPSFYNRSFEATCNESSWLLCSNNKQTAKRGHNQGYQGRQRRVSSYGHRALLYDNISFADSSPHIRLLNSGRNSIDLDDFSPTQPEENVGRFRIWLACYLLIGITLAIYSRNCLSLVAVEMIASNKINKELMADPSLNNISSKVIQDENSCPIDLDGNGIPTGLNKSRVFDKEQFMQMVEEKIQLGDLVDWSPGEQGLIFASGSVGNLLIAIPLTRLGEIYGPKWIIFLALTGATLQAALMPIVAGTHVSLVIIFQIIFNGLTFGADCVAYTFFAQWLTPTEVAFFVACLLVCYQLGAMISSAITAKILVEGIAWSWCFYTPAILCAIWTVLWAFIGDSEPAKSWIISDRELEYLLETSKISQMILQESEDNLGDKSVNLNKSSKESDRLNQNKTHVAVSYWKMAKDPNIWAIVAVKFTLRWYFSVYNSMMPTYLSSVAHMSISKIGKVSVFQSFVGLFSGLLMSYLTRSVVSQRPFNLKLSTVRKVFQSIVNFGLGLSLLMFITFDCNQWVTIVSLSASCVALNFYVAAALQVPLDLSPEHCGLITSISNTLALGQALGAPISGLILNHGPRSRTMWRIVWGLAIVLNTLSGFLFILLVDSKNRDYNDRTTTKAQDIQVDQARKRHNAENAAESRDQKADLLNDNHCQFFNSGKSSYNSVVWH